MIKPQPNLPFSFSPSQGENIRVVKNLRKKKFLQSNTIMFRFNRGRVNQRGVEQLLLEIKEFQPLKKEMLPGVHPEQNQILH